MAETAIVSLSYIARWFPIANNLQEYAVLFPSCFLFSLLAWVFFPEESSHETFMVTTHVDHVVGPQRPSPFLKYLLLRKRRTSVYAASTSCPAFQPITSLVAFVESVSAPQLSLMCFELFNMCFSNLLDGDPLVSSGGSTHSSI